MRPGDPKSVEQLFNEIAPRYDFLNDVLSFGLHRRWKRQLLLALSPRQGEHWVDLCCGTGDLTIALGRQVYPNGSVIGIDAASKILEFARQRTKKEPRLPITFKKLNALDTGLPSFSFDGGVMAYGLRNLSSPKEGLSELKRLLKPGARGGILDFNKPLKGSLEEIFQRFYLRAIVVPVSTLMGLKDHYSYLEKSLLNFPDGTTQERLALEAGFSVASYKTIANGQMGLLVVKA